jgi:post-segregation antitoxin (ccd killing protein)
MGKIDLHLSIDAELFKRAEAAGVDPSEALEEALLARLDNGVRDQGRTFQGQDSTADARAAQWAAENADAIRDYNRRVAERGVFGEEWRRW